MLNVELYKARLDGYTEEEDTSEQSDCIPRDFINWQCNQHGTCLR